MDRRTFSRGAAATMAATTIGVSTPARAANTLTVWWVKGYYRSEDEALFTAIKRFKEKTGVEVELSQYSIQDTIPKTVSALDAGTVPDVAYSDVYDFQVTGKWAAEDRLEDISDILTPIKDRFAPNTLETTFLHNTVTGKRAYYAFPIKQQTMHVQYWDSLLKAASISEADIPKKWADFWTFWGERAQTEVRKATRKRLYGIGQPMGVDSSDSFYSFLTVADAWGVKMVDDEGKLLVSDPKVRDRLIEALTDYVRPYQNKMVPPSATSWKDPDNNVAFHNQTTIMTHNATISIAAKWLDDANNPSLTEQQRAEAKQNYEVNIRTAGFPARPDGSPMRYRAAIKTGVIFKAARNKERAREFVQFLLQEENLRPYVEGSLGRWFPVTKEAQASPFWEQDPHRRAVHAQFKSGTVNFEFTKNWRFTILNNENVWAKAMNRVVNERASAKDAIQEMITRIEAVAGNSAA